MIPGIYGVFPTADGWIAIVGTAGRHVTSSTRPSAGPTSSSDSQC